MKPVPLIGSAVVARIAGLLDARGIPANRYLARSRIAPGVREDPVGFVTGRSAWAMIAEADRAEGLRDFWLDIASLADWRRAGWVRPMSRAATLGDALRVMCSSYVREIPMNRLGLSVQGPMAWFWRRRIADVRSWEGSEPAEMYTLSFMLEVVRAAAGPGWLPERLKVESGPSGWLAGTDRFRGVRVEYDRPLLALAIPTPLLSLPVSIRSHSAEGIELEPAATDFQGSLRQVLRPWLEGHLPDQQLAAERLWTSPRTLRRRLAEEGTTWRAVSEDLVFARAVERLMQGRPSVRELSEELGYSDAAHFTRFFRRRAGVPPSAFRAEAERAGELAAQAQN
jgi:AraC-like DNA-binding protein